MENKLNKKIFIAVAAVAAAAVLFAAYFLFIKEKPDENLKNVTVIINTGNGDVSISVQTEAGYVKGVLDQLQNEGKLTYTAEESQYGFFITALNGRTAADEAHEYFAIYVKEANAAEFAYADYGISQQVIKDGDSIKIIIETY